MNEYIIISTWFNGHKTAQTFIAEQNALIEYKKPLMKNETGRKLFSGRLMAEISQ